MVLAKISNIKYYSNTKSLNIRLFYLTFIYVAEKLNTRLEKLNNITEYLQ